MKKVLLTAILAASLILPAMTVPAQAELPETGVQIASSDLNDFKDVLKLLQSINLRQVERRSQKEIRSHIEQREAINAPVPDESKPAPSKRRAPEKGRILRR